MYTELSYILDQICKNTELYPYIKQHSYKRNDSMPFYAITSYGNATVSEAEVILIDIQWREERHRAEKSTYPDMLSIMMFSRT